jgi:UDP-sulfoquinovose synthase
MEAHHMRVLVLGADGFIGWATTLYLSAQGHEVCAIDDLSRRRIDGELGVQSLTPIQDIWQRLKRWEAEGGQHIEFHCLALDHYLYPYVPSAHDREFDAVVHLAEQRAAPYSMKNVDTKNYTVARNITTTHNLLSSCASADNPPHIVHINTMGRYGYGTAGREIPEGYWTVCGFDDAAGSCWDSSHVPASYEIPYPYHPGSVYHLTKCMDELMFHYYAKNDGLRISDLAQGVVWGVQTDETRRHPELINRFDYCGDFGTVLNRFLCQAAVRHPLTVHGTGGQTRAFIHIRDSLRCIDLALQSPPARGDRVRILNQMTECHRVRDLATLIAERTGAEIAYTDNPRNEADENDLMVANDSLLKMGLEPTTLADGLLDEIQEVATKYKHRVDLDKIPCRSVWTREQKPGVPK